VKILQWKDWRGS